MLLPLFLVAFVHHPGSALCPETNACIDRIRRLVAEPRRFWFGEQWKELCTGRHRNMIDCYNPQTLQPFHTLGGRMFRVKTYQSAFLQNLRIFPRVTYRTRPGSYRACDHDFVADEMDDHIIEADPDMDPVKPFHIRYLPDIRWPGINRNQTYIILMMDAGFGTINYLAYDYPKNTKVLKHYVPSENFRLLVNPLLIMVFKQNNGRSYDDMKVDLDSELFILPQFMIENSLESDLVGMNVVLVTTDAYSIEKQRMRAIVDNCHSLVEKKLRKDNRWSFVASFPMSEIDTSLAVDYQQPTVSYTVCCEKVDLREMWLALDPLGDGAVPSLSVLDEPRVSAIRIPQNNANYQRNIRDFVGVVLFDHTYTLVLLDPDKSYLYWMVIDIPSASLAAASLGDGTTIAPYVPPIPHTAQGCSMLVFMLFTQPRFGSVSSLFDFYGKDHALRSNQCKSNCSQRRNFDIENFKSLHQLKLSAINWMRICYDIHEARRQIHIIAHNRSIEENRRSESQRSDRPEQASHAYSLNRKHSTSSTDSWNTVKGSSPEEEICPLMKTPSELRCAAASNSWHIIPVLLSFVMYVDVIFVM